jgi:hypothetical protein
LSASVVLHATHAAPEVPQLVSDGEVSHVDPEQHPVLQPVALQSPGHTPAVHMPVLHAAHAAPPVPHCDVDVPSSQVVPLQHPLGQDVGLQVHVPPTQAWPFAQAEPVLPQVHVPVAVQVSEVMPQSTHIVPRPHVVTDGVEQVAPRQQPEGHEPPLHMQVPPEHSCPAPHDGFVPHRHSPELEHVSEAVPLHAAQAAPPFPQLAVVLPPRQVAPEQQPLGQEVALQIQVPAEQIWPAAHCAPVPHWHAPVLEQLSESSVLHAEHAAPPIPHAASDGELHVEPEQQPGQELAHPLHVFDAVQVCGLGQTTH